MFDRLIQRKTPLLVSLLAVLLLGVGSASAEMESALLNKLAGADLRGTQVSICVMDVGRHDTLAAIEADRQMIPASNMKLVTTAAALEVLGEDFTFSTRLKLLGVKEAPAGDGLPALVVVGDGDPAFGAPKVLEDAGYSVDQMIGWWLDAVEKTGMDHFGQLVIDDRIFENGPEQRVHPSWPRNQLHRWYCAQVSGLNFYDNCFRVTASPTRTGQDARVAIYPYGKSFIQTEMRLVTGKADQWDIITQPDSNKIVFRGQISNEQTQDVTMHDPAMVFGELFRQELAKRGVTVDAVVRPAADKRLADGRVLHKINTTLQAVLNRTNQASMNLYAEALLKRMGYANTGAPGNFQNGAAAIRGFLADHFDNPTLATSIQVADGSGMSRDNRVSARALVEVLRVQATGKHFRPYLASLAQPGKRGSLEDRLADDNDLVGDLYAKTGTINHVCTLSGYLVYPNDGPNPTARVIAFSILVNGHGLGDARNVSAVTIRQLQDELVKLMDQEIAGVPAE